MNKRGKSWHLIVTALLIVVFSFTALFGVSYTYGDTKNVYIKGAEDIRFGIDIRGGVDSFQELLEVIDRLREGRCTIELGFILQDLITNYERISDHCSNIAVCVIEIDKTAFDTHEYLHEIKTGSNSNFVKYFQEYENKYALPKSNIKAT